jgi:DNA-binding response OmpR family regulator
VNYIEEENKYLKEIIEKLKGSDDLPIDGLGMLENNIVKLLKNANGRFLTRSVICDALYWQRLDPPDDKSITVAIWRIRTRRPDIGSHIKNRHGEGYQWVEKLKT